MKIAYASVYDAADIRPWSGLVYHIARALASADTLVAPIDRLKTPHRAYFKAKRHAYRMLLGKNYNRDYEPTILRHYARQVERRLAASSADVVFSPNLFAVSHVECRQPIVFWADAAFAGLIDFYPSFTNLCDETIAQGHAMDRTTLDRCALAIYSSDWAARSAIAHYGVSPSKVRVVPFGANVECRRTPEDIDQLIEARDRKVCKLLFLGVEWTRKGGDTALAVARRLNEAGLPTELTVVGCDPEVKGPLPPWVKARGFISKTTAAGRAEIGQLLGESHFLIVPSRAEAFGIVFGEASSYGLPSIATSAGGIPSAVTNGVNGMTFPLDARDTDYAEYILETFSNPRRYRALARSSFEEYTTRLNWASCGREVRALLKEL